MINNYLDWAKTKRNRSIADARRCMVISRESVDAWAKGFYQGMKLVHDFDAQHWLELQKDIEARNDAGDCVGVVDGMTRELSKVLS